MRRVGWFAGRLAAAGVLLAGAWAGSVQAGEYTVRQCAGAGQSGFDGIVSIFGADRVDFTSGCLSGGSGRIGVYQDRSGPSLADGVGGQFAWDAPAGAGISATAFDLKMKDANGIVAAPVGRDGPDGLLLDEGRPHDGSRVTVGWSDPVRRLERVAARLVCRSTSGCANLSGSVKAFIEVFNAEFTLEDRGYPVVASGGTIWGWADERWHRGSAAASLAATDDGGGVGRIWAEVNGVSRALGSVGCPGLVGAGDYVTSTVPCPPRVELTETLDTAGAPFREGENRLRFCAADLATGGGWPNRGCGPTRTILIDNQPPAAPIGLSPVGGSGWRPENRFEFTWEEPGDQLSPLAGGSYRLLGPDGREPASEGELEPARAGELGPLSVPAPGEYELELRLRDSAGNLGAPARTTLRFDDRPPGNVAPEPPAGWISADELPLRQPIEQASPGGPSGIGGYAIAVSADGPTAPCPTGICLAPQYALGGGAEDRIGSIPGLAEGSHWISAVASSGAAVSSTAPGSTAVRVDRTPPRVTLDGVPTGWSNRAVTVTAAATDPLSGMNARPAEDDGSPETVIQAEGHSPYRVAGPGAGFTITAEGRNLVRYWARDLAGNANDGEPAAGGGRHEPPGEAVVRIDTTAPRLTFVRERDPAEPERVEVLAEDVDSGPAGVVIGYRRAGSGGVFTPLRTEAGGESRFRARIPSDDLAAGSYELRATGYDRAGNSGAGDRAGDGSPMLLRLPLKERVRLRAGLGPRQRIRASGGPSRRVLLTGRLTSAGQGLPGASLTVTETLDRGSRPARRVTRIRTDGSGRFALRLKGGPGRRVRVGYAGTATRSRAGGPRLRLNSRGRIRMNLRPTRLRNGGTVTMRGRVATRGALLPAWGKLVTIQYLDPDRRRWRPVEVLRTGPGGRFRFRYRFRTISSAQRIIFRALALGEQGWPYLGSTSGPRSVIVYPGR
ncbi:MAG: hypothetical protein M9938_00295 [Solirubrobacterales bacterium]|nr:hypothetical protein [Solirubrobacterales bacterium]